MSILFCKKKKIFSSKKLYIKNNLDYTGNDEMRIKKQLVSQGVKVEDVFLTTCDTKNDLSVYLKKNFNKTHDVFE